MWGEKSDEAGEEQREEEEVEGVDNDDDMSCPRFVYIGWMRQKLVKRSPVKETTSLTRYIKGARPCRSEAPQDMPPVQCHSNINSAAEIARRPKRRGVARGDAECKENAGSSMTNVKDDDSLWRRSRPATFDYTDMAA